MNPLSLRVPAGLTPENQRLATEVARLFKEVQGGMERVQEGALSPKLKDRLLDDSMFMSYLIETFI